MQFSELLALVGREPVFETGLLLSGDVNPDYLRRQLSGWTASGKLWQLRRGLYTLAPPYRKETPHPFLIANRLVSGSYVSLEAALAYYDLIPEYVAAVTSVTTGRPGEWVNRSGRFLYRHIQPALFFGYERIQLTPGQMAFMAMPEKALLDLVYFQPDGDSPVYLESLRLQNLDRLNIGRLREFAERSARPKLQRAATVIVQLADAEAISYEIL
jgi:predicted transcriptional regulator of viral defense system